MWVLDHSKVGEGPPSLTAFDIQQQEVVHRFEFPYELAGGGSMLADFWVDSFREIVYIADGSIHDSNPALIVYDVHEKKGRRVLQDHESMKHENFRTAVGDQELKTLFFLPLQVAVDSIALSPDDDTLYYGAMTGSKMYRIDTKTLRDPFLKPETYAGAVSMHGKKPNTDGIVADGFGNLYLTAIEHSAIYRMDPEGKLEVLARDEKLLSWPSGLHLSADGESLLVAASQLHLVLAEGAGSVASHRPYRILEIPLPSVFDDEALSP